ncbi:MAG: NAD(P)/FAD-dependent oxidoreductase [Candidatus Diapherotrites archaeon]|nr:NAD(P)/FAD-dependent oxidoreductase [Candidatus Diapherotrites archaeon]
MIVVGAGPAGLLCAKEAASLGAKVTVYEEHKKIGEPVHCTGLVSKKGLDKLNVEYEESVLNKCRGARFYSPGGEEFEVKKGQPVTMVIDRSVLDKTIAEEAEGEGAEIITGKKWGGKCDVAADGPLSKWAPKRQYVHAYQVTADLEKDEEFVEIHWTPGFFAWVVPVNAKECRVGIGVRKGNPREALMKWLHKKGMELEYDDEMSALIPLFDNSPAVVDGTCLVGDAAAHVKATSIDAEEPVVIQKNGLIRTVRIGAFVNGNMKNPRLVKTPVKHLKEKIKNWSAFSIERDATKPGFWGVGGILKHDLEEDLFELILKNGYRVKATASHSVLVAEGSELKEKKVSELREGYDHLLVSMDVPNNQSIKEINLVQMILEEAPEMIRYVRVKGGRELIYSKVSDVPRRYQSAHWVSDSIPLENFLKKGIIPQNVKISFTKSRVAIPNIIRATPEFARLLGYYVAEGSSNQKAYLTFGENDRVNGVIDDAEHCIKKALGVPFWEEQGKNPKTGKVCKYNIGFGGKLLSLIFKKVLKTGGSARTKEVPFVVFNMPNNLKYEFLKAYLVGDGTIRVRTGKNRRNWSAEISAKTASYKLASDLVLLSLQLGLYPSIEKQKPRSHTWNGKKIKSGTAYKIGFYGNENLKKLLDVFPNYKKELQRYLKKIRFTCSQKNFPLSLLPQDLREYLKKRKFVENHSKTISYGQLTKILDTITPRKKETAFIKNLVNNNVVPIPIKKIRKVKPTTKEVFDLEIPNTNIFVGGMGPILLHNTGGGVAIGGFNARICGAVLGENRNPGDYEALWRKEYGKDLAMHRRIRNMLDKIPGGEMDELFGLANAEGLAKIIERHGDMERPWPLINALMSRPGLAMKMMKYSKYL